MVFALALACSACVIGRDFVGNELNVDPAQVLHPGETTLDQALEILGAPDRIQHRAKGEILIYRFARNNSASLHLQDPVVTGVTFFVYTKQQAKSNRLVLFFDPQGKLAYYGYTGGVEQLDLL